MRYFQVTTEVTTFNALVILEGKGESFGTGVPLFLFSLIVFIL